MKHIGIIRRCTGAKLILYSFFKWYVYVSNVNAYLNEVLVYFYLSEFLQMAAINLALLYFT